MPLYLTRDLAAFVLGLTPRYGYSWPSAVEGAMGHPCDGFHRVVLWTQREGVELFVLLWAGVMFFALDLAVPVVGVVVATIAVALRSAARQAVLTRTARRTR